MPHMLIIRLQRTGRKNDPAYRVVLTDSKNSPQSGKFKEILGSYVPKANLITFKADRVKHWISVGAKTSGTIHNFLIKQGIIEGKKINVLSKKTKTISRKELKKK